MTVTYFDSFVVNGSVPSVAGQTVRVVFCQSSSWGRTASIATVVADEIASSAGGLTNRPSITMSAMSAYDSVNNRSQTTGDTSITVGNTGVSYRQIAYILGGSDTIGNTSGTLICFSDTGSSETIAASSTTQVKLTLNNLNTTATTGN
jgi:hypothetical protein